MVNTEEAKTFLEKNKSNIKEALDYAEEECGWDSEFLTEIEEAAQDFLHNEAMAATGCSKFCLLPLHTDYVLKTDYVDDYAAAECEIYHSAIEEGIEEMFAATSYIGSIGYYDFYAQEKAETYLDQRSCSSPLASLEYYKSNPESIEAKKDIERLSLEATGSKSTYCYPPLGFLMEMKDYYGEDKIKKFMSFVDKHNVNDLHKGNIGYIDGRPIIFDFSGFDCC